MRRGVAWISAGVLVTTAAATTVAVGASSCAQTPTNVPVRSLVRSGRMDTLCFHVCNVNAVTGNCDPVPATPVTSDHCAPVPSGVDPTQVEYNLVALVTQTERGELAAVDITLGHVVDTSRALPGLNFLPVGQNPTDVVVTPDAQKVFVAAAEINKPAIYMLPTDQLLGDSQILAEPTQAAEQLQLPTWPVCSLPQAPGRMVLVPTNAVTDAGGDAGVTQGYEIVVSMPGNGVDQPALVGLINTAAFDSIAPGSLAPCPIEAAIQLAEAPSALPTSWTPGPAWPNGLPYVDGGIDLFAVTPPTECTGQDCFAHSGDGGALTYPSQAFHLPLWQCPGLAHDTADAGASVTPNALATTPGGQVHGAQMATDGRFVWIGDDVMPFIHVIDTGTPGTLTEIAPLVTSSMVDPSRVVTTGDIAVSPVTRDLKRYLYAVDALTGTIMVYDVTDPANGPRMPLTRPNPELNPLEPPDRIALGSPVSTLTFARHDFPIPGYTGTTPTGVLCNPNPNAGDVSSQTAAQANPGIEYRANGSISVPLGPKRLRGVFAFATLTSGQVVAIDVDDWDAPCRRPLSLVAPGGSLAVPEPNPTDGNDVDPYHVPTSGGSVSPDGGAQWVSIETMWPIIQPNRVRSYNVILDDLTGVTGLHDPNVVSTPQLLINGAPTSITGSNYTVMTAAMPEFFGSPPGQCDAGACTRPPSPLIPPNVFMSHDVPDVHVDQTWNVIYEGSLPGFDGATPTISTTDNYATMTLSMNQAFFCARGVEDQRLGLQRLAAMKVDDAAYHPAEGSFIPVAFDQRVADYVQFTDDLLGAPDAAAGQTVPTDDVWWHEDQACWNNVENGSLASSGGASDALAEQRQSVCIAKFGAYGSNQNPQRDFPILEAYDDHLVLGRFDYLDPNNRPTNGRIVAPPDNTPHEDFMLAQCCFHNQAHVHVRTGAEWVAIGSVSGYLHHVVPDPNNANACVQSCNAQLVLLSARAPELAIASPNATFTAPTRNSPFAMRNPAFSFFMPAPVVTGAATATQYSNMERDDTWQFSTRGQYQSQSVALTTANTSVLPQSSLFIPSLGAIGVVDGSANGVFIIDLNTLAVGDGSPFY